MAVPKRWIALVARNAADARDYMVEGPGGLARNTPPAERPSYEPSKRRVTWPNGSWGTIYTDEDPDQLRGFSGDTAWLDEFAKYKHPQEVWDNLNFGMREASSDQPRKLITTTPRPLQVLRDIERDPDTVVVVSSSYENRANLAPEWFDKTLAKYKGTRLGKQEIEAQIIEDVPGALWRQRVIDETRVRREDCPLLQRIVVGVDPAITTGDKANETGIIAAGLSADGHAYVLDDWTVNGTPDEWANKAVGLYRLLEADCLVAEVNQGGLMVQSVISSVAPIPVKMVRATRGKFVRAEPISAIYEQRRAHHAGVLPDLEDQMTGFTPERAADRKDGYSPDRVDALVWALTELFPGLTVKAESRPIRPAWEPADSLVGY